ncbi:hypothetical protein [Glaciihabitans sp. dw_435]|uniref:hypothetical protein n=1 Tax=Glaciihabitans sp. dw_435 TaxID=2720081 RepID=UPI001BD353C2|nr:hypothetical protein [Glaciihabitans sp. dw_435]
MSNGSTPAHPSVNVEVLAASAAENNALVDELVALINEAYAAGGDGLWSDGGARTTPDEVADLVSTGQIAVARANGQLIARAA